MLSDDTALLRLSETKIATPRKLSPSFNSANEIFADKDLIRENRIKEKVIHQFKQRQKLHHGQESHYQGGNSIDSPQNMNETIKDNSYFPSLSLNKTTPLRQNEEGQQLDENSARMLLKPPVISSTSASTSSKKNKEKQKQQHMSLQKFTKLMKASRQFKQIILQRQIPQKALKFIKDIASNEHAGTNNAMAFNIQKSKMLSTFSNKTNKLEEINRAIKQRTNRIKDWFLRILDKNIPVLNPLSTFRICFDVVLIITIVVALFFNTIEVFFDIQFNEVYPDFFHIIKLVWILIFLFNVILNYNTGIYQKGIITTSHEAIWTYYFHNRLLSDILSIVSLVNFSNHYSHYSSIYKILKLFILLKIPLVVSKLNFAMQATQTVQQSSQIYNLIRLIKLIFTILFVAHFVAISFYGQVLVVDRLDTKQETWISLCKMVDMSDTWAKKYVFALYFSVTTMVTVGYGDITPVNTQEAILVIISMVIASGIFAYTFNLIGSIISDINKQKKNYKKKVQMMNIYLADRNVDPDLRYQVQKFLEYKFQSEQQLSKEEEEYVLTDLSQNLQDTVNFQVKQKIFQKGKNIFSIFSHKMRNLLCLEMKEIRANKGEIIFQKGDIEEDPKMYFIHRGSVDIIFPREIHNNSEELVLSNLQDGKYFGEVSFLISQPRLSSAKINEPSILYSLSRSDFLRVIATDKSDLEKFFLISSKLVFNKSLSVINGQCYYCQKESHSVNNCPFLHYSPALDLVILKDKYSVSTLERQYQDRQGKKYNTRFNLSANQDMAMKISRIYRKKQIMVSQISSEQVKLYEEDLSIAKKLQGHRTMTNSSHLKTIQREGEGEEHIFGYNLSDHSSQSPNHIIDNSGGSIPFNQEHAEQYNNSVFADNIMQGSSRIQSAESIPEEAHADYTERKEIRANQVQSNNNIYDPQSLIKLNQNDKESDYDQEDVDYDQGDTLPCIYLDKDHLSSQRKIKLISNLPIVNTPNTGILHKKHKLKRSLTFYSGLLKLNKLTTEKRSQTRQLLPSYSFLEDTPQNHKPSTKQIRRQQSMKYHIAAQSTTSQGQQIWHQSHELTNNIMNNAITIKDIAQNYKKQPSSLQESNQVKPKDVFKQNENSSLDDSYEMEAARMQLNEDILSRFDVMHEFKFYYPHFNYKSMIQNYNRLRNFQNIKLPSYFGVYSFVNRKDRKLRYRLQTLGIKRIRQYEEEFQIEQYSSRKMNNS